MAATANLHLDLSRVRQSRRTFPFKEPTARKSARGGYPILLLHVMPEVPKQCSGGFMLPSSVAACFSTGG
jgi:hypothetical protein